MLSCAAGWSCRPVRFLTVLLLGLMTPETPKEPQAPEQARTGDFAFNLQSFCPDFHGTMQISFAGDEQFERRFPHFLTFDGHGGGIVGVGIPLPRKLTVTVNSKGSAPRKFEIDVPSVEHRTDYLTDLYVILQKDGTPAAKLILEPSPVGEMLERKDKGRFQAYRLLPDDANPNYRQYRDLCLAISDGGLQKVKRLLAAGVAVEWDDPRLTSAFYLTRDNPKMVDLFLEGAKSRLPSEALADMAGIFLQKNDCATADRLVQVLLKVAPDRKWGPALMSAAVNSQTVEPLRYVVKRLRLDPNMTLDKEKHGQGALYAAVSNGNLAVVKFLLTETKADPNRGLPEYSTLDRAEEAKHAKKPHAAEIVKLLREHGARESAWGPNLGYRIHSRPVRQKAE